MSGWLPNEMKFEGKIPIEKIQSNKVFKKLESSEDDLWGNLSRDGTVLLDTPIAQLCYLLISIYLLQIALKWISRTTVQSP